MSYHYFAKMTISVVYLIAGLLTVMVYHQKYPQSLLMQVTERVGFEPTRQYNRPTPLAGAPLKPLEYLSKKKIHSHLHIPVKRI